MPSLGGWMRTVRDARGLSRRQAGQRAFVSGDYIKMIETGTLPRREIMNHLIAAYGLGDMQTRHSWELWAPAAPLPSVDELRTRITAADRQYLARLDDVGIVCVLTDPLWNVLAANESFHHTLPGVTDNVAVWFLHRHSNQQLIDIVVNWEQEARFHIAMLQGALGRYRDSPQAKELLDRLRRDSCFTQLWHGNLHVAYARPGSELAHLRDPTTHERYSINIRIAEFADTRDIRICHGFRQPYAGPTIDPEPPYPKFRQ